MKVEEDDDDERPMKHRPCHTGKQTDCYVDAPE